MSDENSTPSGDATNVHDFLGIRTVVATPERVVLELDVTAQVHQPFGIMHGGVSALLAEGAASLGGVVSVEAGQAVVGTELNISHLRPIRAGVVTATATPIRKGRTVQVWAIVLTDQRGREISVARCSLQVVATNRVP
ncbi:MAG: hotdog fold thioesterase [Actinomycetota bacterium]|nr:hotdog fold thioesterase [Actinomycetota bacterium]